MRLLSAGEAIAMEPSLLCTAALLSPSTGIVDSHSYMLALQGDAESQGAMFAFHSPVKRGRVVDDGIEIEVGGTGK
jgi:L-2-hydroxyglutarate oxidase LhgO